MMHKYIATIILSGILLTGCNSDVNEGFLPDNPVPGYLVARVHYGVTMDTAFQVFNRFNLGIELVKYGFYNESTEDTLLIDSVIQSKAYLNYGKDAIVWLQANADLTKTAVLLQGTFKQMTLENQADWITTVKDFHFTEMKSFKCDYLLKTPDDTVYKWIDQLKRELIVTDCNYAYDYDFVK